MMCIGTINALILVNFFFYYYVHHLHLHSFPTRRSSDLGRSKLRPYVRFFRRVLAGYAVRNENFVMVSRRIAGLGATTVAVLLLQLIELEFRIVHVCEFPRLRASQA